MAIKNKTIILSKKEIENYSNSQINALDELVAYAGYDLVIKDK
jgi:hypothetical protein